MDIGLQFMVCRGLTDVMKKTGELSITCHGNYSNLSLPILSLLLSTVAIMEYDVHCQWNCICIQSFYVVFFTLINRKIPFHVKVNSFNYKYKIQSRSLHKYWLFRSILQIHLYHLVPILLCKTALIHRVSVGLTFRLWSHCCFEAIQHLAVCLESLVFMQEVTYKEIPSYFHSNWQFVLLLLVPIDFWDSPVFSYCCSSLR